MRANAPTGSLDVGLDGFASFYCILVLIKKLCVHCRPSPLFSLSLPWVPAPGPQSPEGVSGPSRPNPAPPKAPLGRRPPRASPAPAPPLCPHPTAAASGFSAQKQQRQRRQLRAPPLPRPRPAPATRTRRPRPRAEPRGETRRIPGRQRGGGGPHARGSRASSPWGQPAHSCLRGPPGEYPTARAPELDHLQGTGASGDTPRPSPLSAQVRPGREGREQVEGGGRGPAGRSFCPAALKLRGAAAEGRAGSRRGARAQALVRDSEDPSVE